MAERTPREPAGRLVDFPPLAAWMQVAAVAILVGMMVAIIVDGMLNGLTFSLMLRWVGAAAIALVVLATLSVAVHALRGASSAQRRGERLSSDDVGVMPRRRPDAE